MRTLLALAVLCLSRSATAAAPTLSRTDFNRLAARNGLPLFRVAVDVDTAPIRPEELIVRGEGKLDKYVAGGKFTAEFDKLLASLVEERRQDALRQELDQGRPAVIFSDFRKASAADRALVASMVKIGALIDTLYTRQAGGYYYLATISDPVGKAVFARNQGPWCEAPATQDDPFCNASPAFPEHKSDAYPDNLKQDGAMCEDLKGRPDGKLLLDPFTVVREKAGKLVALPLHEVYGPEMRMIGAELRAAAAALQGAEEAPLQAYLLGAAKGFETNDWSEADEMWSRMNGRNSKWYVRVAPDEVYFDPCQEKAGFHLSFAKIDPASLAWADKLTPIRQEMEDNLSKLIGKAYPARKVAFTLPDFIEIVVNSGDSKPALGATIGQSLPNWGKVAEENRRRTVVMTNILDDSESKKLARLKAAEMLSPETMTYFSEEREPGLVGTILHEATHNLGPHSDSRVNGKTPTEVFGGRTESTLEELKAQTGGVWYVDLLKMKGHLNDEQVKRVYVHEVAWCFGHIAMGFFNETGNPKPYSQLAALQIGTLVRAGALKWQTDADGVARYTIDFAKLPAAIEGLMKRVGTIKASGDVDGAKKMLDEFITGDGAKTIHAAEVQERLRRYPKVSFGYTVLF